MRSGSGGGGSDGSNGGGGGGVDGGDGGGAAIVANERCARARNSRGCGFRTTALARPLRSALSTSMFSDMTRRNARLLARARTHVRARPRACASERARACVRFARAAPLSRRVKLCLAASLAHAHCLFAFYEQRWKASHGFSDLKTKYLFSPSSKIGECTTASADRAGVRARARLVRLIIVRTRARTRLAQSFFNSRPSRSFSKSLVR